MQGLGWFKNVVFIGSKQDHYVSQESALMMKMSTVSSADLHNQMANNILKNLNQGEIVRVNIDFKFENGYANALTHF